MLEVFAYPVSVVMKLWHLLIHDVFGVDASGAWVFAIIGLVLTVRGLLVPFAWAQKRSAHRSQLMRPERAELERRYGDSTDPDDIRAHQEATKELFGRYGYRPAAGCIPPLIQIPVILGLYRLLLWMSRPELLAEHSNAAGGVGVLTAEDVATFSQARLFDVPLPAYLAMDDGQFAALGTDAAQAWSVILPFVITAAVFTTMNMAVTVYFNYKYLDWSSKVMRGLLRVTAGFVVFMPLFILLFGIFGPLPFALVIYWVMGNLWTTVQITIINILVRRRWPEDETHRQLRVAGRQEVLAARADRRARRTGDRDFLARAQERGQTRSQARAELKARDERKKQAAEEEKQRLKQRRRELSQARGQVRAQQFREAREAREAQRKKKDQIE